MKEQKDNIFSENSSSQAKQKQPYEKPRLNTVTLFADQVMGACRDVPPVGTCNFTPPRS